MNYRLHCTCKLAEVMRDCLPLPGVDFKKIILVDLQPGENVIPHQHEEHVVIYYPHDSDDELLVKPKAGMFVYIPPETHHEVPTAAEHRTSIAMVVDEVQAQD